MLTLLAILFSLPFLGSLALTPRPTPSASAGRGARHRAPGLPKLIKGDGPATVTGLARAALRRAELPTTPVVGAYGADQLDDSGQLELIR
jgi:hypothetical protein